MSYNLIQFWCLIPGLSTHSTGFIYAYSPTSILPNHVFSYAVSLFTLKSHKTVPPFQVLVASCGFDPQRVQLHYKSEAPTFFPLSGSVVCCNSPQNSGKHFCLLVCYKGFLKDMGELLDEEIIITWDLEGPEHRHLCPYGV